jgi:predicted nucleotidyltransferase
MPMKTDEIFEQLRLLKPRINMMNVKGMAVFGSRLRGDARADSDIDILIDPAEGATLFDLADVRELLERELHCRVDLVTRRGLHPALKDKILSEAQDV